MSCPPLAASFAVIAVVTTAGAPVADAAPARPVGPYGPPLLPLDPAVSSWQQLKDRHAGAECLLIGNGPSLNKVDWSFLDGAQLPVVMGANKIYLGCVLPAGNSHRRTLTFPGVRVLSPASTASTSASTTFPVLIAEF